MDLIQIRFEKKVEVYTVKVTGNSVTGKTYWRIESIEPLTVAEIHEFIQEKFPVEGYGFSSWGRLAPDPRHIVEIISNSSCD